MDAVYLARGNVMVTMTVGIFPMNSTVFIQLQLLLPPNRGLALQPVDPGNINATTASVFTNGMYVMVLMTVGITQMNGFVVLHQPQLQILPRLPIGVATSGSSPALMGGASTMGTGAMGGMTVETIVMRSDVPLPQLSPLLRRFHPAHRDGYIAIILPYVSKQNGCVMEWPTAQDIGMNCQRIAQKPQEDPLLVQAVNTSVRMEDVFHSSSYAMESSSVSMAQMSQVAVAVSLQALAQAFCAIPTFA